MDQRDLVIRAKEGDHDAFTSLVASSIARLDAAARLILRDGELARDAVQDALRREPGATCPGCASPTGSTSGSTASPCNACLDLRAQAPASIDRSRAHADRRCRPSPTRRPSLAERQLLDDALGVLEPGWRAIVVMHYYLGMPLPDVAVALRIPLGTAKSRLHRSLREMRASLGEKVAEPADAVRGGQLA